MEVNELRVGNYVLGKYSGVECKCQHICVVEGLDGSKNGDLLNAPITLQKTDFEFMSTDNKAEIEFEVEYCDDVKSIGLTEEILLKCGAIEVVPKRGVLQTYKIRGIIIEISNSGNFYYKNTPISLHRLQNLYFAEYGEELTIKF